MFKLIRLRPDLDLVWLGLITSESPRCLLRISLSLGIPRLPESIVGSGGRIQHVINKRNCNSIYWKLIIYYRPTNSSKLNFFQFIYILLHCVLTMSPLLYILLSTKYSENPQCGTMRRVQLHLFDVYQGWIWQTLVDLPDLTYGNELHVIHSQMRIKLLATPDHVL